MSLNLSSLVSGLAGVFASMPPDGATAAMKISIEYDNYCKAGTAPPGLPVFTGAESKSIEGPLAGAFASGAGATAVAAAFAAGIQAYWLAPPVAFVAGPVAGVATAMPGAAAVIGPITGALLNLANTPETAANLIGVALDVATRTVLVTYATPPPPAGPPPPALLM